jgi:UDP-N-acetylmuramate--alanine ligase
MTLPNPVVTRGKGAYRRTMSALTDPDLSEHPWFFCGIGGSGMLPLALILKGHGAAVAGSDRSRDQGRTPEKFAWLERDGFALFPQDGSGITAPDQILVASAAVEGTVPEMVRAKALGCARMSRAELLARLFNAAPHGVAIGGTSGKSTVTGMTGWILTCTGRDPTIMNGAVMKNFAAPDAPFASARVGSGDTFVSEVDESDGSIALYRPAVSVLLNVSLDHKSMEELRELFGDFLAAAQIAAINADDPECLALVPRAKSVIGFGIESAQAEIGVAPGSVKEGPTTVAAAVEDRRDGSSHALILQVPGRHNLANALAAIASANAAGVPVAEAVAALGSYAGLARRFEIVGTSASGVTVIDDFGHNPEKCAATLRTLKAHPGRVIAFFQPHGYGPLRQMGHELAEVFARLLGPNDLTVLCDPVYFGGTVDRSEGSERIVRLIREQGGKGEYIPARDDCGTYMAKLAQPGDRIVIMGARDDTLSTFAKDVLAALG